MIIELRRYSEIEELHIENGTTGSQAQVSYQNEVQEASVTKGGCLHGGGGDRDVNRAQGTYKQPPSQDREQVCMQALWSNQKSISMPQDKID